MSLLIKGMDMPENCHECEFVDILPTCPCRKMADEDFWNNVSLAVEGHKDCPIAPVPPHGRLIDADALVIDNGIKEIPEYYEVVCDAPTIIPAEPAEEGE